NMNDADAEHSIETADRSERLESWKEIAAYLGRGVTTVQRWEQQEGLPIHRLPHAKKGSIFALKSELDEWRRARTQLGPLHQDAVVDPPPDDHPLPLDPRRPVRLGRRAGVVLAALLALVITWLVMSHGFGPRSVDAIGRGESSVVPRPLANDAAPELCPSLSPDGSRVVYYWGRDRDPGLYIKPLDGAPRRLSTGGAGEPFWCGYPKWSPSGDFIAFLAMGDGES